jgi:hypothetical protein
MAVRAREPYFVYVDETGDRGWGGGSSPYFALMAVIVKGADDPMLRACLDQANVDLRKPPGFVLHWYQNIRDHSDRRHVAGLVGALPVTCTGVLLDKGSLIGTNCALDDHVRQYNYLVRRLLERVTWYVNRRYGIARLYFGHVRRFKYDTLEDYIDLLRRTDNKIVWGALHDPYPIIEQPKKIRGLQVADIVSGSLHAALHQDRYGVTEISYLRQVAPLLWSGPTRKLHTYGLQVVGNDSRCYQKLPWWAEIAHLAEN